jgi:hypothetical protein
MHDGFRQPFERFKRLKEVNRDKAHLTIPT